MRIRTVDLKNEIIVYELFRRVEFVYPNFVQPSLYIIGETLDR